MTATRHLDDEERRRRLVRRHHLDRSAADPHQAVADLLAMHSSDPLTPFLGLWARVPDLTVADVEHTLYTERRLWRLHGMRRTLWVITAEDAPLILTAAAADVAVRERRKLHGWVSQSLPEVDATRWVDDLTAQVRAVLADGIPRTTAQLGEAIPSLRTRIAVGSGRWTTESPVSSRLLFLVAMDGHIVRGPSASWRSSQYRWADVRTWFGRAAEPLPAATARAELTRRWLATFGPATTADLRWWTGWTVARSRAALAAVDAVEVATDGGPCWVLPGDEQPDPPPQRPVVALLPGLDPTAMGWKGRTFHLDPGHATRVFDRNGNAGPTAWVDGQIVGGWGQRPDGEVVLGLLADIGAEMTELVRQEAARLTDWLDGTVVTPRFASPLSRELMA